MSDKQKLQELQERTLKNITKYVCGVAGSVFIAADDKTIKEELAILVGEVENSINDK